MAKSKVGTTYIHEPVIKKTSIGGNMSMIKKSSMNKDTKRGFKKYRGQGR